MSPHRLLPVLLLAAAPSASRADVQAWTTLSASGPVSGKLLGNLEAIARFGDDDDGLYEAEFGGFIGYAVSKRAAVWLGYTRVPRYRQGVATSVEDRLRQQVTADLGKLAGGSLSGRVRMEQRFRGGGIGWRLRPQVRFARPLAGGGPSLVFSHESFVALGSGGGQRSGYERMRNFAGLSVPLAARVKGEIGYLNQHDFRPGAPDATAHAGTLSLAYSF